MTWNTDSKTKLHTDLDLKYWLSNNWPLPNKLLKQHTDLDLYTAVINLSTKEQPWPIGQQTDFTIQLVILKIDWPWTIALLYFKQQTVLPVGSRRLQSYGCLLCKL